VSVEREERLFRMQAALEEDLEAGRGLADSVYAQRFDLAEEDVLRARQALELLLGPGEPVPEELPPPELPADYELAEELGRGGMGVVYRVHQKSLDRDLALKVLRPGEAVARRALERFQREARSLARLRHPHIASVHEVGECGGRVYFTMDLIEGDSLAQRIRGGSVTPSQAVRWMRQVTSALQYVHSHGLVHRDIKPANILIDREGDAHVVDFGLAREVETSSDLTQSGHFLGTPAYMSPEQARGEGQAVGELTDVYAVGAVLYECLTGRRAFEGRSIVEVIAAVTEGAPTPPSRLDPKVPRGLERLCLKAMARDPEDRYVTARALLEDLERFEAGQPVLAEPPSWGRRWRSFAQRNRGPLVASLVTAAAMVLLFVLLLEGGAGTGARGRLDTALELAEAGRPEAAVQVFASVYPEDADLGTLRDYGLPYVGALVDAAEAEAAAGERGREVREKAEAALQRVAEARALLERLGPRASSRGEIGQLEFALLIQATRAAVLLDREPEHLERLALLAGNLQSKGNSLGVGALEGSRAGQALVDVILARSSLPALVGPPSAARDAAAVLWARSLSGHSRSEVHRWLREEVEERERVIVALLETAAAVGAEAAERGVPDLDGRARREWMETLNACDRNRLRDELVAALRGEAPGPELRRLAGLLAELPVGLAGVIEAQELAQLLDPASGMEGLRLERAMHAASLKRLEEPGQGGGGLRAWRGWWRGSRPRADIERELGLEAEAAGFSTADWLELFDGAEERDERLLLHSRLQFELRRGEFAPSWPASFTAEPPGLGDAWHEALTGEVAPLRWRLRLSGWRYELGDLEPRPTWERRLEVVEGESFELPVPIEAPALSQRRSLGARLARRFDPSTAVPRTTEVVLRGRLGHFPGGVGLSFDAARMDPPVIWLGTRAPHRREAVGAGEPMAAGLVQLRRSPLGPSIEQELVLAAFESLDATDAPWTWEDWRGRAESRSASGPQLGSAGRTWLARMLGIDPSLPRSGEARPRSSSSVDLDGLLARGYVACGDAAEREDLAGRLALRDWPADLRLELGEAALAVGGELDPKTATQLRRDAEELRSGRRKAAVLWTLGGLLAFMALGGLWAAARYLWRGLRSGTFRERMAAISRDEKLAGAMALLPTNLFWLAYADASGWGSAGGGRLWAMLLGVFLLYVAGGLLSLAAGLTHPARRGPGLLLGLAGLLNLGAGFGLYDFEGRHVWPWSPAGLCLLLGLVLLPWVCGEIWDWVESASRRRRLRRRADVLYVLLVLGPLVGRMLVGTRSGIPGVFVPPGSLELVATVMPGVGFALWSGVLVWATHPRRAELYKQVQRRERERRRARRSGAAGA